jgi:hypothetical protein
MQAKPLHKNAIRLLNVRLCAETLKTDGQLHDAASRLALGSGPLEQTVIESYGSSLD